MTITLATLPEATEQQVFDQVKNHLLSQMEKAMDADDCAYKSPDGLSCAAGCLISESEYQAEIEGLSWSDLTYTNFVPNFHKNLICDLQIVHDESDPEDWEDNLKALALERNLNWN